MSTSKTCLNCKKTGKDFSYCGECKLVSYCSKKCQKAHWSSHKGECMGMGKAAERKVLKAWIEKKKMNINMAAAKLLGDQRNTHALMIWVGRGNVSDGEVKMRRYSVETLGKAKQLCGEMVDLAQEKASDGRHAVVVIGSDDCKTDQLVIITVAPYEEMFRHLSLDYTVEDILNSV